VFFSHKGYESLKTIVDFQKRPRNEVETEEEVVYEAFIPFVVVLIFSLINLLILGENQAAWLTIQIIFQF